MEVGGVASGGKRGVLAHEVVGHGGDRGLALFRLDKLVIGVVNVGVGAVCGQVAVLVVGEPGNGDLVAGVVGSGGGGVLALLDLG